MQTTEKIRVVVADDHPLVRAGLRAVLDYEAEVDLVGDTATTTHVTRLCALKQADVLLLDVSMPGPGLDATLQAMQRECPRVKVIILSATRDVSVVKRAVGLGALGYILKEDAPDLVVSAIRTVMSGAAWYSMAVLRELLAPTAESMTVADLTERERQILQGIAHGWTNSRIAQDLKLSEQTIRNYTNHLYSKIGVDSRSNAVRWALQHGVDAALPVEN